MDWTKVLTSESSQSLHTLFWMPKLKYKSRTDSNTAAFVPWLRRLGCKKIAAKFEEQQTLLKLQKVTPFVIRDNELFCLQTKCIKSFSLFFYYFWHSETDFITKKVASTKARFGQVSIFSVLNLFAFLLQKLEIEKTKHGKWENCLH